VSACPVAPEPTLSAPVNAPVRATVVTATTAIARTETGALTRRRPRAQRAICNFLNLAIVCFSSERVMGVFANANRNGEGRASECRGACSGQTHTAARWSERAGHRDEKLVSRLELRTRGERGHTAMRERAG